MTSCIIKVRRKGGPGSGNWGHAGRPGIVGGSMPTKGRSVPTSTIGPKPQPFQSWKEAKLWAVKYGIDIQALDSYPRNAAMDVISTLRDVQGKVPVKLVDKISVHDGPNQYYENSREIELYRTPRPSDSKRIVELEAEMRKLESKGYHAMAMDVKERIDIVKGNAKHPKADWHSIYHFNPSRQMEALIRHELGHAFHQRFRQNITGTGIDSLKAKYPNWKNLFAVTGRAGDDWGECVAENFVFWSMGKTSLLHPEIVATFDSLV
jgi:hypothetical protein